MTISQLAEVLSTQDWISESVDRDQKGEDNIHLLLFFLRGQELREQANKEGMIKSPSMALELILRKLDLQELSNRIYTVQMLLGKIQNMKTNSAPIEKKISHSQGASHKR